MFILKKSRIALKRSYFDSKSKISVISSNSNDIFTNLAIEEWIFNNSNPEKQLLYLWQNSPSVIVGKHQNPWSECHLKKMEDDNVVLARRHSGGGTVYQDLGNTCFTFMSSKEKFSIDKNMEILTKSLLHYGINAEKSGRNDITVYGKKISGSAYKKSHDRALHHGTLMLSVNLDALEKYLHPSKEKLKSKGIASVRSRVSNLHEIAADITHQSLCETITKEFCKANDEDLASVQIIDINLLKSEKGFILHYEKLVDWNWRFGKTPEWGNQFSHRFDWGEVTVHLESNQGITQDIKIYSDCLVPTMIDKLMLTLKGIPLSREAIIIACTKVKSDVPEEVHPHVDEFFDWFIHNI